MYDPTFGSDSLIRHLTKSDFLGQSASKRDHYRKSVISQAVETARVGFHALPLTESNLAGRKIYQVKDLPSDLVLRKAAQNIRKITGAKQSSRMEIIRRLKLLCEEGMPFTIVKMDIKSFYPSIDQDNLLSLLQRRLITAPSTRFILSSLINHCKSSSIAGLPPGLAISAELSEFYMQDFDRYVRESLRSHFFARYVDDIVLVLPPVDSAKAHRKKIQDALPKGLELNSTKSRIYNLGSAKFNSPSIDCSFDYLGFRFNVYQATKGRPHTRTVRLDIATSKVKKTKTRVVKSLLQYLSDGNYDDLRDRIRVLTCGYQFIDVKKQRKRNAGLQHTYNLIDQDAPALTELDRFFRGIILCRSGPIGGRLALSLSNREKKELLKYSFVSGMVNKVHFRFSADRLTQLMRCWKYV